MGQIPLVLPPMVKTLQQFDALAADAAEQLRSRLAPLAVLAPHSRDDDSWAQLLGLVLSEAVWPPLRRQYISHWDVRQPEPVVSVFKVLQSVLPAGLLESSVQQLVWPRLRDQVERWNPLKDKVPLDYWLLPWRPIVGDSEMQLVYPNIRHKLASALELWHPSDDSALVLITPWKQARTTRWSH